MKLLVVGSDKHLDEANKNEFRNFCIELGNIGIKKGFEFILGSESDYAPDMYILKGVNKANKPTNVHIISTKNRSLPFSNQEAQHLNIVLKEYSPEGNDWSVARIKQILNADCIIAVGGSDSTENAIYSARLLKKPVLLVPCFQGATKKALSSFEKDYGLIKKNINSNINKLLYTSSPNNLSELAIFCSSELIKNNPYKSTDKYKYIVLTVYMMSLCCCWVVTFFNPIHPFSFSVFLLLGIASFLGSSLRASIKAKIVEHKNISIKEMTNDTMTGLVVSFFFSLIYLVGGVTVKGDLLFLNNADDFQRIGLTMSLLGASSSFLVEKSISKLKNALGVMIDKDHNVQ